MPINQLKRVSQLFILGLKVKVMGQIVFHYWNIDTFRKTEQISTKSLHKKHIYITMKSSRPYTFSGYKVKVKGQTDLNSRKLYNFVKTEKILAESSHKERTNKIIENSR